MNQRPLLVLSLVLILTVSGFELKAQNKLIPVPREYTVERDVVYASHDSLSNVLDIYFMKGSEDPLPLIIWIHGGAWRSGDKRSARFARELMGQGYAVASINYRLSGKAIFPAQIIDCKAAVRWLRAHADYYNIDPGKFAAWGGSAGSHLAALLGTAEDMPEWEKGDFLAYSSRVQAVVDWYGPTDFSRMDDSPGKMVHLEAGSPESQLIGGAVKDNPDKVTYANPITYVNRFNPPFMIYHGKDDSLVLPNQAILLNEAFIKIGLKPEFRLLDGVGHGGNEWNDYIPEAKVFLDRHLVESGRRIRPFAPEPQKRWTHTYMSIDRSLRYERIQSRVTGEDYGFMVSLPESYIHSTERRYPVIYWLHGRGGSPSGVGRFAMAYQQAVRQRKAPEAIIIGVNGIHSSMYTNDKAGLFPVEDVIMKDLIPYVDREYRTIPLKEMRAIDGFSMGGFGAARLGFKYPEVFGVVSIMGAAMHRPQTLKEQRQEIFEQVFGSDLTYCREHSPWTLVRENAAMLQEDVLIRQYVGADDMLVEKNKDFHALMQEMGIPHEFGTVPEAGHNYTQVFRNFEGEFFEFFTKAFSRPLSDAAYEKNRADGRPDPDIAEISYGPHPRNTFDLWLADSRKPTPLMIFIHGGGFRGGNKSVVYNHELNELLHAGISVASINYRLTGTDPLPAGFLDGKRALQYIRTHAKKWNVDPEKIGAYGGSAGAQICMWLGFHKDMAERRSKDKIGRASTQLAVVGSKGGQINMDSAWWKQHIPEYHAARERRDLFAPELNGEELKQLLTEYSAMEHFSAGDPPVYVYHKMAPDDPLPVRKWERGSWQVHHIAFGLELQKMSRKNGVPLNLNYPGAVVPNKSIIEFSETIFNLNND